MKIKKILSLILAVFILLGSIIPIAQAKDNPLYKFPKSNGTPTLISNDIIYNYDSGNKKGYRIESTTPPDYIPIYLNRYSGNIFSYGSITSYVYVDTGKFFDDKPTPILDFSLSSKDNVRNIKEGERDIAGMNMIYYDHEKKTIVASLGYVNSEGEGKHSGYNLYHNIDKNTPNFMFLIDIRVHKFINSMGNIELAVSAYVSRETETGNGILSNERNFLVGSIPFSPYPPGSNLFFRGGVASSFLHYGFYDEENKNIDSYNPGSICNYLGFLESKNSDEYKKCLDDAYTFILEHYFQSWQRDFGLNHSEDTVLGGDLNNPQIKNGVIQIKKIIMDKPQVPSCSFSDSFLGLSCLGEWLSYSFQNLIYFFASIYNGLVDFFNAIISFVVNFFKNLFDGLLNLFKEFLKWIWEVLKTLYNISPLRPIVDFISWGYEKISDFFTIFTPTINALLIDKSDYNRIVCDKDFNFSIDENIRSESIADYKKYFEGYGQSETGVAFVQNIFTLIRFLNPVQPQNGEYICTYAGLKQVNYHKNSWLDMVLIMFFTMGTLYLFFRNKY